MSPQVTEGIGQMVRIKRKWALATAAAASTAGLALALAGCGGTAPQVSEPQGSQEQASSTSADAGSAGAGSSEEGTDSGSSSSGKFVSARPSEFALKDHTAGKTGYGTNVDFLPTFNNSEYLDSVNGGFRNPERAAGYIRLVLNEYLTGRKISLSEFGKDGEDDYNSKIVYETGEYGGVLGDADEPTGRLIRNLAWVAVAGMPDNAVDAIIQGQGLDTPEPNTGSIRFYDNALGDPLRDLLFQHLGKIDFDGVLHKAEFDEKSGVGKKAKASQVSKLNQILGSYGYDKKITEARYLKVTGKATVTMSGAGDHEPGDVVKNDLGDLGFMVVKIDGLWYLMPYEYLLGSAQ